jgi:hypothetical protein
LFRLIDLRLVQVERTNPIITFGEAQEVPKNPPEEELNELQAEVGVFGSAEAWQLVLDFSEACRKFFNASAMLDLTRSSTARPPSNGSSWMSIARMSAPSTRRFVSGSRRRSRRCKSVTCAPVVRQSQPEGRGYKPGTTVRPHAHTTAQPSASTKGMRAGTLA